jgi:hypothetical protein
MLLNLVSVMFAGRLNMPGVSANHHINVKVFNEKQDVRQFGLTKCIHVECADFYI